MASFDGGTITISTSEQRPCMVRGNKALFHRWEDRGKIVSPPAARGRFGRGIVTTAAIVEFENGCVSEVSPHDVKFLDSKPLFSQCCFERPEPEEEADNDTV